MALGDKADFCKLKSPDIPPPYITSPNYKKPASPLLTFLTVITKFKNARELR
jgi:hypothetical protein